MVGGKIRPREVDKKDICLGGRWMQNRSSRRWLREKRKNYSSGLGSIAERDAEQMEKRRRG